MVNMNMFWGVFFVSAVLQSTLFFLALASSVDIQLLSCLTFYNPIDFSAQASLSFTTSQNLLNLMSIESGMPSNRLILYCPLPLLPSVFPSIRVFSNELTLSIRWKSIRASASASVLPVNTQGWFCLTMFAAGYGFMISIGKNSLWDQRNVIAQVFTAV